ncbi:MAG: autotransporter outer membrane beta-barrel domain-containing protein, partial [Gammaproteobacteria bacterium]|nr:autotransporter outer membrane beta-barrel domain-containing protein [Gammaproteobacteria bacterium]
NAANRNVELPADPRYAVDGSVPKVDAVAISSDPGPDEIYTPGDEIVVTVTFTDEVHAAGDPAVTLGIGANDRSAAYSDGSGTTQLEFRYVVADGDFDADGIDVGPRALVGGTIEDANGNAVDRAIEAQHFPGHKVWPEIDLLLQPMTLEVGRTENVDLAVALNAAGVVYGGDFEAASNAPQIAAVRTVDSVLIVTPVSEGTAAITATARRAPVTVVLPVAVEASATEKLVLQHALAAVGRGLLSGAAETVGGRLENYASAPFRSEDRGLAASLDPTPWSPRQRAVSGNGFSPFAPTGLAAVRDPFAVPDPFGAGSGSAAALGSAATTWPGTVEYVIGLRGLSNPILGIGIWGGGDVQTFEGDPDEGAYEGRLTTVHVGVDAIGDGWIAGASLSQSQADLSYEFDMDARGAGDLTVNLRTVYPYVQWSWGDKAAFWTILGFGSGEAEARRDGGPAQAEPGNLSMDLGIVGLRLVLGGFGGLDFALRGDGGMVKLSTGPGLAAIQGLAARVQRFRAGLEMSWPVATGDGTLTPFVDLGARLDGGDGATGGGLEVLGGLRYRGTRGGLEIKGRALAQHAAEGYSETGVAASLFLAPKTDGRGWALALTRRRGVVEATPEVWRGPLRNRARTDAAWSLDGRIGYGFGLRTRPGTASPFVETATGRDGVRMRFGVGYESGGASARSLHAEVSAERHEPLGARIQHGVRLTVAARF